MENQNIYNI